MVVDVVQRPKEGKEYLAVAYFFFIISYDNTIIISFRVVVTLQMASLVSTALSCPLSAGQQIVSALS